MKRDYSAPVVEVVECECNRMVAASTEQLKDGGNIPLTAPERRGEWGDIWSNDKNR